ncbi:hypothetical protein [Caloranaerobacter azorensis]|nr:hypothetical protein [Caloranaerobacter azorensis]
MTLEKRIAEFEKKVAELVKQVQPLTKVDEDLILKSAIKAAKIEIRD